MLYHKFMEENFFVSNELSLSDSQQIGNVSKSISNPYGATPVQSQIRFQRFNDLDSTLIDETAYKEIKDEIFRLEYRINQLEDDLRTISKQIFAAKDINDFQKIDILTLKKHQAELELNQLYKQYNEQGLSAKLSGGITYLVSPKPAKTTSLMSKIIEFLSDKVLSKLSGKFESGRIIKSALCKLDNINKNVDELVSMNIPYGESPTKYEQLTGYLSRANVIQYQISKLIGQ